MHVRHWPANGFFLQRPTGIHNRDLQKDIADYLNNKRYQTVLTSLIPVVLFYTDQKKEMIQIGAWPCLLSLLEIVFLFRFFFRLRYYCLRAFFCSGFRSFYLFIIVVVVIIFFFSFLRRRFCS